MTETTDHISLPETDYLAILDLINKLNECETRQNLKQSIEKHLLPLLNAQACLYVWCDQAMKNTSHIDAVNIPDEVLEMLPHVQPYDPIGKMMAENNRAVIAADIDVTREDANKAYELFQEENPQYAEVTREYLKLSKTGIAVWDPSERTVSVGIHRHVPHEKPFTLRDVRVLELIRPHLLNTIKTIFLSEELAQYKSLAEELADCATAMALVRADRVVVFQNQAFEDAVHVEKGQRLSVELSDLLDRELSKYKPSANVEGRVIDHSFFTTQKMLFKLSVTLLAGREEDEEKYLLVQLKLAIEPLSKMSHLMQEKKLTPREIEVAILSKDGINVQEIADRLFISSHTAKAHMKSIHKKFNVQTRGQLIAALNKSELS